MKKLLSMLLCAAMTLSLAACGNAAQELPQPQPAPEEPDWEHADIIELSDEKISVTFNEITTEIAGVDGSQEASVNDENGEPAVTVAKNIIYYEDGHDFTYGEGESTDEHTQEEADKHTVVHITEPGSYAVSGKLSQYMNILFFLLVDVK